MATLGDLKARIADEILKRNLSTQIARHIARAIEFYAGKRFWFNTGTITGAAASADADSYLDLPAGTRLIDEIRIGRTTLTEVDAADMDYALANSPATADEPYDYTPSGERIRVYPTPSGAVEVVVVGTYDLAALSSDASSNAWTNEASDLIAARARMTLYRDVLRDKEGVALARDAEREALSDLNMKTIRRLGTGRVKAYL